MVLFFGLIFTVAFSPPENFSADALRRKSNIFSGRLQIFYNDVEMSTKQCAGSGVQESTPAGVIVFQPEQDQEWKFLIGTGPGAGVIFSQCF